MIGSRKPSWILAPLAALILWMSASAQAPNKIDIAKMNPPGLLVDAYSYMAQPYSFYYFHHMDELGFRLEWVRKGSDTYPLKEATRKLSLSYAFHGGSYSLDDYFGETLSQGFSFCTTIRSCLKSTSMERTRTRDSCLSPSENRSSRFWLVRPSATARSKASTIPL